MIDGDEYVLSPAYEALSSGLDKQRLPAELAGDLANAADRLTKDRRRLHERIEQKRPTRWPISRSRLPISGSPWAWVPYTALRGK
jgi:hypothetical protein